MSLVSLGVTVYRYAIHLHHPGSVWWILGAALVIAAWSILEMERWRIRHDRIQVQLGNVRADLEEARHERDEARRELETARRPLVGGPAAVNPAEWEAVCNESGAFPDPKALTFGPGRGPGLLHVQQRRGRLRLDPGRRPSPRLRGRPGARGRVELVGRRAP